MPVTLPAPAPTSPLNTLEPRMAKASIRINAHTAVTEAEGLDEAVSLFFATLAEIGMSDKEAAYTMAMDPAQLPAGPVAVRCDVALAAAVLGGVAGSD
jgi:hypothetical protein